MLSIEDLDDVKKLLKEEYGLEPKEKQRTSLIKIKLYKDCDPEDSTVDESFARFEFKMYKDDIEELINLIKNNINYLKVFED